MIIHNVTQGTDEWFAIRCGIPTTSAFSSMVTSTGNLSKSIDDYAITLAADLFAGKSLDEFQGNHYTERGIALEPEARNFYEVQKNIDVQEVGFITDDLHTWGCSPDGLVSDGLGMLEIKCQIPKNHIKCIIDYKKTGKAPTKYIQQIQGQMLIANREYCDLLLYHPHLPSLIIRILDDHIFMKNLIEARNVVIKKRDDTLNILKQEMKYELK
tara:strand:- start:1319 stop:1957 length:639 start_codon:yes stop_codon:yes gene_type:complete